MLFLYLIESEETRTWALTVYEQYNSKMLAYAKKIVHDNSMAEDAVQFAFLMFVKKISLFQEMPCNRMAGYLFIIVKNECIRLIQQKKKETIMSDTFYEFRTSAPAEEVFIKDLDIKTMEIALAAMPENQRNIIMMRYSLDMSHAEIARLLNTTETNSRSMLFRAIQALKKQLKEVV